MKCVVITEFGGPEVLRLVEREAPVPGPREIRVAVAAAGVNRADLMQRLGRYPAPEGVPADVPGLEFAGVVDALGDDVTRWSIGDRVMGLLGGGGYADLVVVDEAEATSVPDALELTHAAAMPEVFITAHDALFTRLRLAAGERLLIHAVGSGVGTAALQLAKAAGATVIGTSRTAEKLERAQSLGLDTGIVAADDWLDAVMAATDGRGVDAIVDLVGGAYFDANLRALSTLGRMVVVGTVAGARAEIDLSRLMRTRATLIGTVLRARTTQEKIEATRAFERDVLPLVESGRVRPIIDLVYPLERAADAHRYVEANESFGKVVLTMEEAA
ncbi:MAG TPA: NAD(P)H-quinone oxidoreductase [Longimicrobiales bacterium]|nr:NAD(P)H-quinone oxidoreductase [Longimicrobiales bacterium]